MIEISAEDMARFHRNASAALARRGRAFVLESLGRSAELILLGAVPIVGLLRFDWSAANMLVFLLAGAWAGILCDIARVALAERAVMAFGQTHYDDWHVWTVVHALRRGQTTAPRSHLEAKWQPWSGVFVDLVTGLMASVLMTIMLVKETGEGAHVALDASFVIGLVSMIAYQVGAAAWEIARHRRGGAAAGPLKATPGMRGLGLFLLMFVMLMFAEPGTGMAARRVMLIVNGAIVAAGAFGAVGMLLIRGETVWLRAYLRARPEDGSEPAPHTPAHRMKKKRRK
jgi:hypothetical protein